MSQSIWDEDYRPAQIPSSCLIQLGQAVQLNQVKYAPTACQLGFVDKSSQRFDLLRLTASITPSEGIGLLPFMKPNTPAFLLEEFRASWDGKIPHKRDGSVFYEGDRGTAWRYSSKDVPEHYCTQWTTSGSHGIVVDYGLTSSSASYAAEIESPRALPCFEIRRKAKKRRH